MNTWSAERTKPLIRAGEGTKACAVYQPRRCGRRKSASCVSAVTLEGLPVLPRSQWDPMYLPQRIREADDFYSQLSTGLTARCQAACSARPWLVSSGANSIYHFVVETWLKGDPTSRRRRRNGNRAAITIGVICSTKTSSRCRISGSIPGMRHGIWHFMRCHGARRSGFRQSAARAISARMVHASERADPGL